MALYKRDKIWWAKFTYRKTHYNVCTGQNARSRAIAWQCKFRAKLFDAFDRGSGPKRVNRQLPRDTTLGELADRYVVETLLTRPRETDGSYKEWILGRMYMVEGLVDYFGYRSSPQHVATPQAVSRYNHFLLQRLSPNVADNRLSLLRAILYKGYHSGVLQHRPYVRLNRLDRPVNRYLAPDEETALLRNCDPLLRAFVCFLLDTGARRSEAERMLWRDVDLKRKPRASVTLVFTKNGRARIVPLPNRTASNLRTLARRHKVDHEVVFGHFAPKRIFNMHGKIYAHEGAWIPISNLDPKWRKAKRTAKLDDVRMHDLRHTYASRLLRRGASLYLVARLLGHRSLRMTMRYATLTIEGLDEAVALLDEKRPTMRKKESGSNRNGKSRRVRRLLQAEGVSDSVIGP